MAYAALVSLKQTMQFILNTSKISILSQEIIKSAYEEVSSLQEVLQRFNSSSDKMNVLNGQIREASCKIEDTLESHVCLSGLDVEEVKEEISSFTEMAKKMKKMMAELGHMKMFEEEEEEDNDDDVSSRIEFGVNNSKMVGFSDEFLEIKRMVIKGWTRRDVISLVGMAGIGKTTLAMKVFEDQLVLNRFELRAFVTVGPKYRPKNVIRGILAQMNHDIEKICLEGDEKLGEYLRRSLKCRRYLIVLDDVWNTEDLDELKRLLPDDNNGSRVLLTTRLKGVARCADQFENLVLQMHFLNKEESWDLLREKVFGEICLCPPQLEKAGKKIAENCEGLPLAIVTVAKILSKGEKTVEYWKKVAKKENSVFSDANDQMSKVLYPSYKYLPQHLKPCFLYTGVFPQSHKIPASKLIKLWSAEGFLEPNPSQDINDFAIACLEELVSRSLVLVCQKSSNSRTKTCSLHFVHWHLCLKEAEIENFVHVVNSFVEGIKSQRRLCIHNNVLLGIKAVDNSMESISMVRSLLCTGPYHQYPVPICFGSKLLRVLDALTIRFYKFPIEVLELVQLRYLALTCNGKIPGSISKLQNLEYFIVCRCLNINKSFGDCSYLPMEIWNMKELRHLQVMGSNLPYPHDIILPNLLTLSYISARSCTKEILERVPNLKKLGIQIELALDATESSWCYDHLSLLSALESFKFVVVNPKPMSRVVTSITTFPSCLKKLSLSGLGYPWEGMRVIGELPNLEVLKLRCYAFKGPEWGTCDWEFLKLKFLLLEDTDLVHWRVDGNYCFPFLRRLVIKHCYKLKEIPSPMEYILDLEMIELVDCPLVVASVKQIQKKYAVGRRVTQVHIHSSRDDRKQK